jgi:hypothetical protein
MRLTTFLCLATCVAFCSLGCKPGESSNPAADAKVARAKEEIKRAASATAEAAAAKRDQYAEEMKAQLASLDTKIAELKEKSSKAAGQAKKDFEQKLAGAKVRHADAAKKLDDLKTASAERWEKLKEGLGKAFDDLKKVVE